MRACCARAASGQVAAAPPMSAMNSRLFMCGWPPPGKRSFGVQRRGRLQSCVRPHMMVSPSRADLGRSRSKVVLSFLQGFPCKPHIRRELIPATVPHSGRGELQENGTTLCRRRCSAMPNNGDVSSDHRTALRAQRRPDWRADQAAGFKTAPSGTTPSMTNLHSAISSFRAKATTMILRTRRPVDPTRSRNQQT